MDQPGKFGKYDDIYKLQWKSILYKRAKLFLWRVLKIPSLQMTLFIGLVFRRTLYVCSSAEVMNFIPAFFGS